MAETARPRTIVGGHANGRAREAQELQDHLNALYATSRTGPKLLEVDRIDVTDLELGVVREAMRFVGVEADERLSFGGTADLHVEGGAEARKDGAAVVGRRGRGAQHRPVVAARWRARGPGSSAAGRRRAGRGPTRTP